MIKQSFFFVLLFWSSSVLHLGAEDEYFWLKFKGNATYSSDHLRSWLNSREELVDLEVSEFVEAAEEFLKDGYLNNGFADVEITRDISLYTISEGSRYVNRDLIIDLEDENLRQDLFWYLTEKSEKKGAIWESGKHTSFHPLTTANIRYWIRKWLKDEGVNCDDFLVSIDKDQLFTDLHISFDNISEIILLKTVTVVGAKINSVDSIIEFADLKIGAHVGHKELKDLRQRLRDTGCFVDVKVNKVSPEEIEIIVEEHENLPTVKSLKQDLWFKDILRDAVGRLEDERTLWRIHLSKDDYLLKFDLLGRSYFSADMSLEEEGFRVVANGDNFMISAFGVEEVVQIESEGFFLRLILGFDPLADEKDRTVLNSQVGFSSEEKESVFSIEPSVHPSNIARVSVDSIEKLADGTDLVRCGKVSFFIKDKKLIKLSHYSDTMELDIEVQLYFIDDISSVIPKIDNKKAKSVLDVVGSVLPFFQESEIFNKEKKFSKDIIRGVAGCLKIISILIDFEESAAEDSTESLGGLPVDMSFYSASGANAYSKLVLGVYARVRDIFPRDHWVSQYVLACYHYLKRDARFNKTLQDLYSNKYAGPIAYEWIAMTFNRLGQENLATAFRDMGESRSEYQHYRLEIDPLVRLIEPRWAEIWPKLRTSSAWRDIVYLLPEEERFAAQEEIFEFLKHRDSESLEMALKLSWPYVLRLVKKVNIGLGFSD